MTSTRGWMSAAKKKSYKLTLFDKRTRKDEQVQGRDDVEETSVYSDVSSVSGDIDSETADYMTRSEDVEDTEESYEGSTVGSYSSSVTEPTKCQNMKIIYKTHSDEPEKAMKLVRSDNWLSVSKDQVLIKIEASTVSSLDCAFRRGDFRPHYKKSFDPCLPATPGVDCVGTIVKCGSHVARYGLFNGDQVAGLSISGGNSRYLVLSIDDVVKVPDKVNPVDAVCLVSTYVAAFQALNYHNSVEQRYKSKPLKGLRILVAGGSRLMDHALIELSKLLGADRIFCPSNVEDHAWIKSLGGTPLPSLPEDWLKKVEERIDLAVDGVCIDGYESPRRALNAGGNLVCIGMSDITKNRKDFLSGIEALWTEATTNFMSQTVFYGGIMHSKYDNLEQYQYDLEYLIKLLATKKIKPPVHRKIPLRKVPLAHSILDKVEKDGFIVCQPWMK